jgi:hypothetical protein
MPTVGCLGKTKRPVAVINGYDGSSYRCLGYEFTIKLIITMLGLTVEDAS